MERGGPFCNPSFFSLPPLTASCCRSQSQGSNRIACGLCPDLPLGSRSRVSNPLISELTSTHCPASCYSSLFNLVDAKRQVPTGMVWLHSCRGLTHDIVRHLVACVQRHACGVMDRIIQITSRVINLCLQLTLLILLSAGKHDRCMSVFLCCLPAMRTPC